MIASESISKYFENIEAGRGPPEPKKKTFFYPPLFFNERNRNEPASSDNQTEF